MNITSSDPMSIYPLNLPVIGYGAYNPQHRPYLLEKDSSFRRIELQNIDNRIPLLATGKGKKGC